MLSRKTKYGLKALTYIAKQPIKETVLIQEIADAENISKKLKGKGGGYYLIKTPDQVKMASVIRVLEGPIALLPCVSLNFYEHCDDCPTEEQCSIHNLMIEVRDQTLKVLENKTLADLI